MEPIPDDRCEHCTRELTGDIWRIDGSRVCGLCVGPAEARGGQAEPVAIACHIAPAERERIDAERVRRRELALGHLRKRPS